MTALAVALVYSGLAALCLTTERYVGMRTALRVHKGAFVACGTVCLSVALAACASIWGWSNASLGWFGMITIAGLMLSLLLPYAPKAALTIAVLAPFAALTSHLMR